jgi:hypothetical protein
VIYSQETRSKLVFMVEAVFDRDTSMILNPGQPVDVYVGSNHGPRNATPAFRHEPP